MPEPEYYTRSESAEEDDFEDFDEGIIEEDEDD